ncbi:hypothetical protein F4827_006757 [Paraburkholderia bannensis]|uniref:Uncharacterized protein n=1 Tax=Paraburkholderia bannensis TaxID=765414 RepID=A0A7W9U4J0_9BURK|nr:MULTISPECIES: hypothetical protein [Paraburkholderia]MBB3261884.1 hypothetical protein [Paraburkholderia sp. WP4_3_2]MBB6106878.1 hypothetical protein [Paraburkholderia bannensis]
MFADMDRQGRAELESLYDIDVVSQFKSSTFRGARANSLLVAMTKRSRPRLRKLGEESKVPVVQGSVVRGGLACFEAVSLRGGLPFIHSTDIKDLVRGAPISSLRRVRPFTRGIVAGHMILLPRVGIPKKENIGAWHVDSDVQLSDCVLALPCGGGSEASARVDAIQASYEAFAGLYRGTGARYVTVERLLEWLNTVWS